MKTLISFFLMVLSFSAHAERIYVAPVQGTNVPKAQLQTLRELVKIQVQNQKGHRLVDRIDQAQSYIQTKLIKLDSYTLSLILWEGDKKKSWGQWKAQSLADLETQIAVAVPETLNKKSSSPPLFRQGKSLGEQAAEKKQRSSFERVQALRQVTLGFGPAYFSNMNTSDTGLGFSAGYIWNIDDHFDLGLQSDFALSTEDAEASLFSGRIITNYFLLAQDVSPFLGAGFGYAWAGARNSNPPLADDRASGFALSLQAGLKFFRTSNVNFAISAEYQTVFDRNSLGNPGVTMLKVALFY